jgi:hypothetical protein
MTLAAKLSDLLEYDPVTLRVKSRESSSKEFKQTLDKNALAAYAKSLVAFSNSKGGVIIYGITDKHRKICGIDPSQIPDEAQWVDFLRNHFDPLIDVDTKIYEVSNQHVYAISVGCSSRRPVLCRKNLTKTIADKKGARDVLILQEGAIYYRYAGQSRLIGYPELVELLEERDNHRILTFMENLRIMQKVGFDRIGVVDVSLAAKPGKETRLYVSKETAKSLNFIDQGRLVETESEGAPAYVVMGTVQLNQILHAPLDEADKNLPEEAAEALKPHIEHVYWPGIPFTAHHLAKLAKSLGVRSNDGCDPRYCVEEKKLKRLFYTEAALELIRNRVAAHPGECIKSFASKASIQQYQALAGP